jgi:hypothetical protein
VCLEKCKPIFFVWRDVSWYRLVGEKGRFEGDGCEGVDFEEGKGDSAEDAQGGFLLNLAFQREAHERGALTPIPLSAEPASPTGADHEAKGQLHLDQNGLTLCAKI